MLIITAKNTLKPGAAEAFKAEAAPLIEASRAEEGNISYDLFEDVSNPGVLTFIEKWRDDDAIKLHNKTAHFIETIPKLSKLAAAPMEVNIYRPAL